jgi:hypothetical protein
MNAMATKYHHRRLQKNNGPHVHRQGWASPPLPVYGSPIDFQIIKMAYRIKMNHHLCYIMAVLRSERTIIYRYIDDFISGSAIALKLETRD